MRSLALAVALCTLLAVAACAPPHTVKRTAYVFSSRLDLIALHSSDDKVDSAFNEALAELQRLERDYHAWEDSKLTELNGAIAAGGLPHPVSEEMERLIGLAADMSRTTNGLFNPAYGKLFAMWGFHSDTPEARTASIESIDAFLRDAPSMESVVARDGELLEAHPQTQLDFGAILKGYGLDVARGILERRGIENALLDFGSTVLAMGYPEEGREWSVGIREAHDAPLLGIVKLKPGEALSVSGTAEISYVDDDGSVVSHLFNPRTGRSASDLRLAAAVCGSGCGGLPASVADALTTALLVTDAEEAGEIASQIGLVDYILVERSGPTIVRGTGRDPGRLENLILED